MKRIKELIPGALDNFNAYYDTRYKNGDLVNEGYSLLEGKNWVITLSEFVDYFNNYLSSKNAIELVEVTDEQRD
ncbi:hypothetical protein [Leuconostoc gasicomitatum]|uniref:hypothetical protein n=1 Tax=Leuconostoc gasicomitatum TaxID=115778 RepID=UPI001CC53DAF|nr:hypothetical protein [Leuconostoc gasicomitatum]MBZ5971612.1 hypothetical protein [Leuconostoc gasicomitatum]